MPALNEIAINYGGLPFQQLHFKVTKFQVLEAFSILLITMVNFSCFSIPPVNRSKKTFQASVGKLLAHNQSVAGDQSIKLATGSARANPMLHINNSSCYMMEQNISPCSQGDCWKSDDLNANLPEDSKAILQTERIKKSHSLGNMLEKGSHFYGDAYTEDDYIDHGFSFHQVSGWNMKGIKESSNNAISTEIFHQENVGENYHNQKENVSINSFDLLTETMHHESVFSVEVLKHYGRDTSATGQKDAESGPSGNISMMARSYSVANLRAKMDESSESATSHQLVLRRSRSFSDLNNFNGLETELLNGAKSFDSGVTIEKNIIVSYSNGKPHPSVNGEVPCYNGTKEGDLSLVRGDKVRAHDSDGKYLSMKFDLDDKAARNFQCNVNFADDYRKSEANDAEIRKSCLQESSQKNWDQLTPKEFSKMRVEHWISQIDICSDLIVEEQGESSSHVSKDDPKSLATVDSPKPDTRSSLAMEVAYNYISSLNASSSSAQMANLGLVAVPVLTLFIGLRVVNLSGNAIVRVTPGSLPKGIHMLNLSKNNISTIEGLRDLSRLRVLDLSYNRITRIGHGLASCSSLKELYLAGNKISEVEGLHRLLKLHILDLQYNKVSTAKGLGQLAANYGSLQAINLEGNPAQRNVGDGQLRKFLLGLLPNLVYYNKQAIRMGSKDVSDRTTRAIPSPQFDRGIRAEHKLPRRGSHGSGLHQLASSNGWQNPAMATSAKLSKDRHVRLLLPPDASKLANQNLDTGKKLLSTNDAVKRNRSTESLLRCYFKS